MVALSLLHRAGHFQQRFDASGWHREEPVEWKVEQFLAEMPARTTLTIEGRKLCLRCWKYEVQGIGGFSVPVYLLDTDVPENSADGIDRWWSGRRRSLSAASWRKERLRKSALEEKRG